jgi:hypothetical protein
MLFPIIISRPWNKVLVVLQSLKVERQEIPRLYEQIQNSQKRIYSTDKLDYRTNVHNGILLDENIKQYCMAHQI